jgi:hypothetical protein
MFDFAIVAVAFRLVVVVIVVVDVCVTVAETVVNIVGLQHFFL